LKELMTAMPFIGHAQTAIAAVTAEIPARLLQNHRECSHRELVPSRNR
jgi:hypothetical protein